MLTCQSGRCLRRGKKRKGVCDMLSQKAKDLFGKLGCEFQPVAIKYCYAQPEGVEHVDETLSLCQFAKKAAVENKAFYITKDDENCMGKMILGMEPKPALGASGQAGKDFGVYKSQAPNARLYHEISCLNLGTTNFVVFSPVAICDFDPDLVFFVADFEQADVLLRATSYISGDLWESRCSCVMGCAWLYGYPYVKAKVNYMMTGLGHGMRRRHVYPAGRFMISIPYSKIDEVVTALDEMRWDLIALSDDPADKEELKSRMDAWATLSPDFKLGSD